MAKLFPLLIVALFSVDQATTQAMPQLQALLDLNGDGAVDVGDVVLLATFTASAQVRG